MNQLWTRCLVLINSTSFSGRQLVLHLKLCVTLNQVGLYAICTTIVCVNSYRIKCIDNIHTTGLFGEIIKLLFHAKHLIYKLVSTIYVQHCAICGSYFQFSLKALLLFNLKLYMWSIVCVSGDNFSVGVHACSWAVNNLWQLHLAYLNFPIRQIVRANYQIKARFIYSWSIYAIAIVASRFTHLLNYTTLFAIDLAQQMESNVIFRLFFHFSCVCQHAISLQCKQTVYFVRGLIAPYPPFHVTLQNLLGIRSSVNAVINSEVKMHLMNACYDYLPIKKMHSLLSLATTRLINCACLTNSVLDCQGHPIHNSKSLWCIFRIENKKKLVLFGIDIFFVMLSYIRLNILHVLLWWNDSKYGDCQNALPLCLACDTLCHK